MTVSFPNHQKALDLINQMARNQKRIYKDVKIIDLPKIERVKVHQLFGNASNVFNSDDDDIEPMKDFYDEMDEDEIRDHKIRKAAAIIYVKNKAKLCIVCCRSL